MATKQRRGKRRTRQGGGKLFLFAGTVAIACVVLLFANALYRDEPGSSRAISSIEQAEQTQHAAGQTLPSSPSDLTAPAAQPVPASQPVSGGEPPIQIHPVERPVEFVIPQAKGRARLAFVIDDGGQQLDTLRAYLDIPMPLAVAVMPGLPLTKESAAMVVAAGKELMLHQPMQSVKLDLWPGPGFIGPDMGLEEIKALVTANLEELGIGVRGMNNHEGSLITADKERIGAVLDAALDYGVFFMDSRTTSGTKAPEAARERGMRILERDIFVDNVLDRDAMFAQVYEGLELANKNGKAIMIGHVDKSAGILPELLADLYPALEAAGYEVVCPSQLMKD